MARRKLFAALGDSFKVAVEVINDLARQANVGAATEGRDQIVSSQVGSSGTLAELVLDHETMRLELVAIGTTLADYKSIYDAHTHKLPATPAEDENTSAPDTTAATGGKAPGAASAFSDTSGSPPAALTAVAVGSDGRVGHGIAVDGSNAENVQFDNAVHFTINGVHYFRDVDAEMDISAEGVAAGDTVTANGDGAFWFMLQSDGTIDVESNQTAQNFASPVSALAEYSVATNTLPIANHCPCAVLGITESAGGGYVFGTDSITAETEVYYDLEGVPEIESELASFVIGATTTAITYGAVTFVLGSGVRVVATGKANVAFEGTTVVALSKTGAYLLYALADDTEVLKTQGSTHKDLQTAKDAVRDMAPNPLLPLLGVLYVTARLNAFTPGTTALDLNGVDTEFVTVGTGANNLEYGRSSGSKHTPIDDMTFPNAAGAV